MFKLIVWDLDTNEQLHSSYYNSHDEAHDWYDMHWSEGETIFNIEEVA